MLKWRGKGLKSRKKPQRRKGAEGGVAGAVAVAVAENHDDRSDLYGWLKLPGKVTEATVSSQLTLKLRLMRKNPPYGAGNYERTFINIYAVSVTVSETGSGRMKPVGCIS